MLTHNPVADLAAFIPAIAMQVYIIALVILVVGRTILDTMQKRSARYFFEAARNSKALAKPQLGGGEKVSIAVKTAVEDVLTSGEFCNPRRRIAHLLTMYGFIIFIITTAILVFSYPIPGDGLYCFSHCS